MSLMQTVSVSAAEAACSVAAVITNNKILFIYFVFDYTAISAAKVQKIYEVRNT